MASSGWELWLVLLALVPALASAAAAPRVQAAAPRPQAPIAVHEVLRDDNHDLIPDLRGKVVTVEGVLTSVPNQNDTTALVHFQDDTGGLVLVSGNPHAFDQLRLGDTVVVRGKVSQNHGMEELIVESIRMVSNGDPPAPRDVRTIDLLGERFSGQLVRVSGELIRRETNGATQFFVRDNRGEIPLFVPWYFRTWRNGELSYRMWKGGRIVVVGIAGQDKAEPPFDAGYGLIPRTPVDLNFPPPPPPPPPPPSKTPLYVAIVISSLFALLALYLWDRRRVAEARTREVSRLLREIERSENEVKKQAAFAQFSPNPVLEFFADGTITYANSAARELASSLEKDSVEDILPPEVRAIVRDCIATRRVRSKCDITVAGRTLSWSFFPVHELTSVHAYGHDVTEQLNLETQLRQAQKLEMIGQLAAGIAHDFNNVLSVIRGYAGLTLMRSDLPPRIVEPLTEISAAAERATNLTRQLLTFSRRQQIEATDVHLGDLVTNLARMLRRLLGEQIRLHVDVQSANPWIHADAGMVEQVIVNLAVNARDAMPQGGDLTLSITPRTIEKADPSKSIDASAGTFVCLSVRDTGAGMDAETLKRIFEPFFTTKRPGRGTGLGLAMVHGIVKQHKGWVDVTSTVGAGSSFDVYFPAVAEPVAAHRDNVIPLPAVGGKETILLVEDDPGVRKLARTVLEDYGYTIIEAASAVEAAQSWRENRSRVQLLFTDIVLPDGVSGWQLAQQLRADNPELKLICATGFDEQALNREVSLPGDLVLLRKPYPVQTLVRAVRECLDKTADLPSLRPAELEG